MGIDPKFVAEIVRRVTSAARPERIILYGSAATGQMAPDSDIDLLVLERAPFDPRAEQIRVRAALRGLGKAFDIVVMRTERFEASKDIIGGLAYPASKYGRVIYEACRLGIPRPRAGGQTRWTMEGGRRQLVERALPLAA